MVEKGVSEGGKKDQAYKLDFWWKIETTTLSLPFATHDGWFKKTTSLYPKIVGLYNFVRAKGTCN